MTIHIDNGFGDEGKTDAVGSEIITRQMYGKTKK